MGVAGSGKSTVAAALASRWEAEFQDGDAMHPASNIDKMRRGVALTDADRVPWLDAVGAWLGEGETRRVTACSSLRKAYREQLRSLCPGVVFLYLDVSQETARSRLLARTGHFMPASLVGTQFATLERPAAEPHVVWVDANADTPAVVAAAVEAVRTMSEP